MENIANEVAGKGATFEEAAEDAVEKRHENARSCARKPPMVESNPNRGGGGDAQPVDKDVPRGHTGQVGKDGRQLGSARWVTPRGHTNPVSAAQLAMRSVGAMDTSTPQARRLEGWPVHR